MVIHEEQLDPGIRQSLAAKVQDVYRKGKKSDREIQALAAGQGPLPVRPGVRTMLKGMLAATLGGILSLLIPAGALLWGGWGALPAALIVIFYWYRYILWIRRTSPSTPAIDRIEPQRFAALIAILNLTPAERAYCDAIEALADENSPLDESTARQVLDRINAVARQLKRIDGSLEYFERSGGADAIVRLESERSAISELLSDCADSVAREDLEQSLAFCDTRLESVRSSGPAIERLTAQKTLLTNTLQTTAASLTRLRTASAGLDSGEIEQVTSSLAQAAVNIESTERALHEVATISST